MNSKEMKQYRNQKRKLIFSFIHKINLLSIEEIENQKLILISEFNKIKDFKINSSKVEKSIKLAYFAILYKQSKSIN
jgi:hypothetical protein